MTYDIEKTIDRLEPYQRKDVEIFLNGLQAGYEAGLNAAAEAGVATLPPDPADTKTESIAKPAAA